MGKFASSEEWGNLILGFMKRLADTPEIATKLAASKMSVRYNYTDPEFVLFVDLTAGSVDQIEIRPGDTDSEADLELTMSADDAHRYWSGKLNPMVAMTTGKIKAKGAIGKSLKLQPVMKPAHALYQSYLEENEAYRKYKL